MAISDLAVRCAKPGLKTTRLFDGGGLYLEVTPAGGKLWRLKYRFDSKEKVLALGKYPEISLKDARERRDEARKLLANEVDPGENRKQQKAAKAERSANSFEVVAREWIAKNKPTWAASHTIKIVRRLEMYVYPWLGAKPIATITAPDLLAMARRIENKGALETAHRAMQNCGQVFRYAVATGRAERDPTGDLRGALQPVKSTHMAAVTEPHKVAELLRTLDGYQGTLTVRCALQLAPLVFVRPGELRSAEWANIDLDAAEWRFTASKTGTAHIVPLSHQSVEILREAQAMTGDGRYVFPSPRTGERPMSDNAILAAMRRLGIAKEEMSGHGFRAMARTILDEVLGFRPDLIEHQLAHAVRDPNGRAYNRTAHLPERRKMMQQWADYLDKLKAGAEIIPLNSAA
ncbi:MAG: tyrosine-type recombinase/integrase [Thiobacillus sp.]